MSKVYEDDLCITHCGACDTELLCDGNGDMPDICPECGEMLDYSFYNTYPAPNQP